MTRAVWFAGIFVGLFVLRVLYDYDPILPIVVPEVAILAVLIYIATQVKGLTAMSAAFDNLIAKVTLIEDRADALIALVNGIAQQLRDNATDPAAVNELASRLDAQAAEITAAIDANTAPPPPTP